MEPTTWCKSRAAVPKLQKIKWFMIWFFVLTKLFLTEKCAETEEEHRGQIVRGNLIFSLFYVALEVHVSEF